MSYLGIYNKMLLFYIIILSLGIVTAYTDIKFKKIKNTHLLLAVFFGLATYVYLITSQQMTFNVNLIWNLLIGLGIGFFLYLTDAWGAGDAKLFAVFCLLMPTAKYSKILFFPAVVIFINIFLISSLAILILSIKEIKQDRSKIIKKIFSLSTLAVLGESFLMIFSLKWLLQAIIDPLAPQTTNFVSIILLFTSYRAIRLTMKKYQNNFILPFILGVGLVSRFLTHPSDFSLSNLLSQVKIIFFYTLVFHIISLVFDFNQPNEKSEKTIPFSPLMFIGTLLTNTNFLNWAIQIFK